MQMRTVWENYSTRRSTFVLLHKKKTKSPREVVSLHFLDYRKQKEIETQREEIIERDSWNTAGYMISIGQCVGNSKNKQTRIICDSKERNLLDKSEEFHSQVIWLSGFTYLCITEANNKKERPHERVCELVQL